MKEKKKNPISVLGGLACKKKHPNHYKDMARKSVLARKKKAKLLNKKVKK